MAAARLRGPAGVSPGSHPRHLVRCGWSLNYRYGRFKIEPRSAGDVEWAGDDFAPEIFYVTDIADTSVLVTFTEAVAETSAVVPGKYTIDGLEVRGAAAYGGRADQVVLTVAAMSAGDYTSM